MSDNGNQPFEIWLVWSDRRIEVPGDQTALNVLLGAGVPTFPGCYNGDCGGCLTEYVEGDVVHMDSCLDAEERKRFFCPCVSRAKGTLALPL